MYVYMYIFTLLSCTGYNAGPPAIAHYTQLNQMGRRCPNPWAWRATVINATHTRAFVPRELSSHCTIEGAGESRCKDE